MSALVTLAIGMRWTEVTPLMATSATEAMEVIDREHPEVILLHSSIDESGILDMIRKVRGVTSAPLLILADQNEPDQVVTALDLGADDYIRLPCEPTEIMVRVWALLRRAGLERYLGSDELLRSGGLELNPATYQVSLPGRRLSFTNSEFRLLYLLMRNRGAVVTYQAMDRMLWSQQQRGPGSARKYMARLRAKLGEDVGAPHWIENVRGVGYRFIGPTA